MSNVTALKQPSRVQAEDEKFLSPADVAQLVPSLSVRTLRELRASGLGPRYFKPTEKTVVYVEADVRAWVRSKVHTTREQS